MIFFTFFVANTLLVYSIFVFLEERKMKVKRRMAFLRGTTKDQEPSTTYGGKETSILIRILSSLWREFKRGFKRRMPGEKEAKIEMRLLQAGRPLQMTPVDFRLIQISLLVFFPLAAGFYTFFIKLGLNATLLGILIGIMSAFFLPHYYIKKKIKQRSKQALLELPDVLDLLTVSLEAGLGFDSALSKLVSKKKGVLSNEFRRCLEEIRLGKTRREALTGVKDRLLVDEIKILISSILQAEKMGIGMVQVLRVQSEEVRDQRKQRAEAAAMKAPIKMLFPLVLFIFPCLFIILLGPVVIQFVETFGK